MTETNPDLTTMTETNPDLTMTETNHDLTMTETKPDFSAKSNLLTITLKLCIVYQKTGREIVKKPAIQLTQSVTERAK